MLLTEEARLKLAEVRQGIALERRHRFVDMQGKRQTFSSYIKAALKELSRHVLEAEALGQLSRRFERYALMDVAARMSAVESLEAWLDGLAQQKALEEAERQQALKNALTQQHQALAAGETPEEGLSGQIKSLDEIPVALVKGVGPKVAALLKTLEIDTIERLLYTMPRQYLDYNNRQPIKELLEGQDVTLLAKVHSHSHFEIKKRNLWRVALKLTDGTGFASASWFFPARQQSQVHTFLAKYPKGTELMLSGRVKWDSYAKCPLFDRPELEILSYHDATEDVEPGSLSSSLHMGRIVPVYPLTQGLGIKTFRRAMHQALQDYLPQLQDPMPEFLKQRYELAPLNQSLQQVHFPQTLEEATQARQRLAFDELFYMQARLALLRQQYKKMASGGLVFKTQPGGLSNQLQALLPFTLTNAQQRVFTEICTDMNRPEPMNRLVHGDVGSGKTIIAALSALVAIENGFQVALMAPTEILAEQHYKKLVGWFTPLGLKTGLLLGKQSTKQRKEIHQGLLNGQIHVAVGTHALIQDDVEFSKLGLVIVDEQHRFGVRQRVKLRSKGATDGPPPELLSMTATPIPRTLAMTVHGDLDVSVIDELPPGRSPIITKLVPQGKRSEAYELINQQIRAGRQAYIVFPLIEESETLSARAASTEAKELKETVFSHCEVGLLHGKLSSEEKEAVMQRFAGGEIKVLVATTVVEVGVDVPNATVMMIESADRFGLAQLHQLRGRVGRGAGQSYCLLLSASKNAETLTRLQVMEETSNGFIIAERDLALRGPGEYLGTRQSGLDDLLVADLLQDQTILQQAREAAFNLVNAEEADPERLSLYPALHAAVLKKAQQGVQLLGGG